LARGKLDGEIRLDLLRTGAGHEEEHENEYDVDHRRDLETDVTVF
jgi:hypothetical protein